MAELLPPNSFAVGDFPCDDNPKRPNERTVHRRRQIEDADHDGISMEASKQR